MKKNIFQLFLMISLILAAMSNHSVAGDREGSFNVQKGDQLIVELEQGNISVSTWDKSEVKILGKNIDDDEMSLLKMEQSSGKLEIKFEGDDSDNFSLNLTVPSDMQMNLSTGGGNVEMNDDIKNEVKIATGGGNISTKNIFAEVSITTGGGNIKIDDVNGDVNIATAGGDIKIGSVNGKANVKTAGGNINVGTINSNANISTAGGNVSVSSIGGNAEVSTAGGNINVGVVSGTAKISTSGGNINLEGATGSVKVNSGAGNINLENIKGSINANSGAGNITASLTPDGKNDTQLNSGVGTILLYIPESSKATIIATTNDYNWGDSEKDSNNIKSDFESSIVTQNRKGSQFETVYKLNGGGSEITLNVGMGEINIKKLK